MMNTYTCRDYNTMVDRVTQSGLVNDNVQAVVVAVESMDYTFAR